MAPWCRGGEGGGGHTPNRNMGLAGGMAGGMMGVGGGVGAGGGGMGGGNPFSPMVGSDLPDDLLWLENPTDFSTDLQAHPEP